jgi:phage tail sheath protein FI
LNPPPSKVAGIYDHVWYWRSRLPERKGSPLPRSHLTGSRRLGSVLVEFEDGQGIRVWGSRTLASAADTDFKYVPVRRLLLFIEESIERGTQWAVFEPNDEPLWRVVRRSIENFLHGLFRSGALAGRTADDAYFVRCDRMTMTQEDIDRGHLICLVGISPVPPAEFLSTSHVIRLGPQPQELPL